MFNKIFLSTLMVVFLSACGGVHNHVSCSRHTAGISGCEDRVDDAKTQRKKSSTKKTLTERDISHWQKQEMLKVIETMIPHCPMHFGFPGVVGQEELTPEENYRQAGGVIEFILHAEPPARAAVTIRRMEYTCRFLAEQKYDKPYWPLRIFREIEEDVL